MTLSRPWPALTDTLAGGFKRTAVQIDMKLIVKREILEKNFVKGEQLQKSVNSNEVLFFPFYYKSNFFT